MNVTIKAYVYKVYQPVVKGGEGGTGAGAAAVCRLAQFGGGGGSAPPRVPPQPPLPPLDVTSGLSRWKPLWEWHTPRPSGGHAGLAEHVAPPPPLGLSESIYVFGASLISAGGGLYTRSRPPQRGDPGRFLLPGHGMGPGKTLYSMTAGHVGNSLSGHSTDTECLFFIHDRCTSSPSVMGRMSAYPPQLLLPFT